MSEKYRKIAKCVFLPQSLILKYINLDLGSSYVLPNHGRNPGTSVTSQSNTYASISCQQEQNLSRYAISLT